MSYSDEKITRQVSWQWDSLISRVSDLELTHGELTIFFQEGQPVRIIRGIASDKLEPRNDKIIGL